MCALPRYSKVDGIQDVLLADLLVLVVLANIKDALLHFVMEDALFVVNAH